MTIKFASNTQRLALDNIGTTLLVRIDDNLYEVSHASRFAQTTDELLHQTKGFIAHMVTDETNDVVATLIAKELVLTDANSKINDLRDQAGSDATPLYIMNHAGIFQVAKIVFEDPELQVEEAEDAAIKAGNLYMKMHSDTSLIASTETTLDSEAAKLHFIATNNSMAYKKLA